MNRWLNTTVKTYLDKYGHASSPVVYDVGSRDGKDGVELASRISGTSIINPSWLASTVVLFECNPLQQTEIIQRYPKAILIKEAICDKNGTAEFVQLFGDKNVVGSSSLDKNRVNLPWGKNNNFIEVKTRRLDDVIEHIGHQNLEIDVMKIDIEGYTYEALQGLGKYLRNVRVFHLETEIADIARNKNNLEVFTYMEKKGYTCTALENEWGDTIQDQVWVRQ